MAEKRNVFIKSKMNKDLDDRLIPDGEYRDAYNVTISKSEGQNVGAVEESPGNNILPGTDSGTAVLDPLAGGVNAIGEYVDDENNRVFIFYSNYCDSSFDNNDFSIPSTLVPPIVTDGGGAKHAIAVYNTITEEFTTLVSGEFLNFSISSPIIGVNLIENLLFWTDNRNQPRKINVDNALEFPANSPTPYYTSEDQISVAKYYPYQPIRLWDYDNSIAAVQCTMEDRFNEFYPANIGQNNASRYTNPTYDANYAGDSKYLEDKFVRFSYRFKFDDNEYSLMAPFTQTAFIPKQDGFFMSTVNPGGGQITSQEQQTYESSVVPFMENKVNFINLHIDLPTTRQNLRTDFNIKEIEILYKESDSPNIKVIDTVEVDEAFAITLPTQSYHIYPYNSTKPVKTLPEKQTTRVWDRVPVQAKTQEVVGNRVLYGNYINRQPYPKNLDFLVGASEKFVTDRNATPVPEVSRVEYPNHTLKQNRSYEVGLVLVDRYGRHSSVINAIPVTSTITVGGTEYGSETVYHPYKDQQLPSSDVLDWCGDSLKVLFNNVITTSDDAYQGLYDINNPLGWYSYKIVVKQKEQDYYNVYLPGVLKGYPYFVPDDYFDGTYSTPTSNEDSDLLYHVVLINDNINKIPRNLTEVGPEQRQFGSNIRLFGRVGMKLEGNPTGALGATDQNHNIQFFPGSDGQASDQVAQIGTMRDLNLGSNKVITLSAVSYAAPVLYTIQYNPDVTDYMKIAFPRDEAPTVGDQIPEFCYVLNHRENPDYDESAAIPAGGPAPENCRGMMELVQTSITTAGAGTAPITVGPASNAFILTNPSPVVITNPVFYSSISDPLIARIAGVPTDERTPPLSPAVSTKEMGVAFDPFAGSGATSGTQYSSRYFDPLLTVYETQAFVSNIDIFYETTSTGLISELNTAIRTASDPDALSDWSYRQEESMPINTDVTAEFYILDSAAAQVNMTSVDLISVTKNGGAVDITGDFELVTLPPVAPATYETYKVRTKALFYYGVSSQVSQSDLYRFTFRCVPAVGNTVDIVQVGTLSNDAPVLDTTGLTLNINPGQTLGDAIAVSNGANASDPRDQDDLLFNFVQQFWLENNLPGSFFEFVSITPTTYRISCKSNTAPGTYTLTLELTDCAGQGIPTQKVLTVNVLEEPWQGGITGGGSSIYGGAKDLWTGGSVYFVTSPTNLYTNFDDVANNGTRYKNGSNSNFPIINPRTYRALPYNEDLTGFGFNTKNYSGGNLFRGILSKYEANPGSLGDGIDNNVAGSGGKSAVWYRAIATTPTTFLTTTEDLNTVTKGLIRNEVTVNNGSLTGGTIYFYLNFTFKDGVGDLDNATRREIFQNAQIQYRPNPSAPWQAALDLNGQDFKGCLWDMANNYDAYGEKAVLLDHAPVRPNEVKYNTDDIVDQSQTWKATGVYDKVNAAIPTQYSLVSGFKWSFDPNDAVPLGQINFNTTSSFINPMFSLRNYGPGTTRVGEGIVNRIFASNAPGEYRIINSNLRTSLANLQYQTSADRDNKPFFQGQQFLPDKDVGKFEVIKGDFNAITPDIWYEYRITGPYDTFKEAGQTSLEVNPFGNLQGGNNWPNTGGATVYAKSPVFRYVKQFYTRSGTTGDYVYAKLGTTPTKYYAYTEPSAPPTDAGAPSFPESAFGARKEPLPYNNGCWPIWIVRLDSEGGVTSTPRPLAVWDLDDTDGNSIKNDGQFFKWYCDTAQAPTAYNGTC